MIAKTLTIEGFRNIEKAGITFCPGVNVVYGPNAQGKTNLLEALSLFSSGKSYRALRDKELINHEKDYARLALLYETDDEDQKIEIRLFQNRKKEIYKNGIKQNRVSEFIGSFTSVLFSPEHLTLVKDGPEKRRKFLDFAICQISKKYMCELTEYNRLLQRRNALLKNISENRRLMDTLPVWNDRLARMAAGVTFIRQRYIENMKEYAKKSHTDLSGGEEQLDIIYNTGFGGVEYEKKDLEIYFIRKYKENTEKDIKAKTTEYGPHRDDIDILINGFSARRYASQGQQRSCVLSLKEGEARMMEKKYGQSPVLLLDDVLSELDKTRREYVLSGAAKRQVIVTSCDYDRAVTDAGERFFFIKAGAVYENTDKKGNIQ